MKKVILSIICIVAAFVTFTANTQNAHGNRTGAPSGRTGSPGDGANCTTGGCHTGSAITNSPNASITSNIPLGGYIPGQTYTITATVQGTGLSRFGFEVSPQNAAGQQRGTLVVTDATNTQLVGANKYITHKQAGTSGSGSRSWSFNWVAPAAGTGALTFYGAFNAANNSNSSSGDIIYLSQLSVTEATTAQITGQPQPVNVCADDNVQFTVTATGSNLTYLWKKGGIPLSNGGNISGATTNQLSVLNVQPGDAGNYTVDVTSNGSTITSNPAALTLKAPTVISAQPAPLSNLCVGDNLTLSVTGAGEGVFYEWKQGNTFVGTNSPTLTLSNVTIADTGAYTVNVQGACGNVWSDTARVNVFNYTVLNTQPIAQTACLGSDVVFTVGATGSNLNYQWYRNNTPMLGQTNDSLVLTNVNLPNAGDYTVRITGSCGGTVISNMANLSLINVATITQHPQSTTLCAGLPLNLSVVGNGGTNTVYQWFFNGDSVGVNSPNYTLPNAYFEHEGQYRVVVSGSCGTVTSSIATVTLIDQTFVNNIFTTTEACGETVVNLSVLATGENLTYQWFLDGEILEGETNFNLPFDTVTFVNSGLYSVAVTGTCGLVTADIAELIIHEVPTFNSLGIPLPVCPGQPITFTASAIGGDITYSWTKNGVEINEEVGTTYTDPAPNDSDVYVITAINVCGQDTAAFIAEVYPEPNPQVNQTGADELSTGTFASYQWYVEGNLIPNATGQTLNTNFTNGNYSVVVTSADGCTDTSEVFSYIAEAVTENNSLAISVYPNPAGADLYFTLPDNINTPDVKIINAIGGLVLNSTVENRYLNIATLPAGFYTIIVQHKGKSGYYRFVKQ